MAPGRLDSVAFALLVLLLGTLLALTTLFPNARSAARLEARADGLAAEVAAIEASCEELRREVEALENDPWFIEREIRRKLKELRRLWPQPPWGTPAAAPVATAPAAAEAPPER